MPRRPLVPVLLAGLLAAPWVPPGHRGAVPDPPPWFQDHMASLTADGGTWITDNSRWHSADEPSEQYGLRWEWGLGRQSMRGRLYGLANGKEIGTFWEFRVYWHPGRQAAVIVQYNGGGGMGEGEIRTTGPDQTEAIQSFWTPDGTETRVRHVERVVADTNFSQSLDWVDGTWVARRRYTWYRRRG